MFSAASRMTSRKWGSRAAMAPSSSPAVTSSRSGAPPSKRSQYSLRAASPRARTLAMISATGPETSSVSAERANISFSGVSPRVMIFIIWHPHIVPAPGP